MSKQSAQIPTLVMQQGPQPQQAFALRKQLLTIGREIDNDLIINDVEISRHHARLTWQGDKWVIEDLRSGNGTFVNGRRISGPTVVGPGSQIGLGSNVVLGMQVGAPKPLRKPRKRKLPLSLGLAGAVALGVLVLGVLVALGYAYLSSSGLPIASNLPFLGEDQPHFVPGPDVAFQEPAPDTAIAVGESFNVSVFAYDALGVVRLDLWVDDVLVLSQSSPTEEGITPLILNHGMVGTEAGSYSLVARAYNSMGTVGESLAVQVTVSEEKVNQPDLGVAHYIAQEGDTVESVAKATNQSASQIQKMNPGINNNLNPGQSVVVHAPPSLGGQGPPKMGALPNPPAQPPAQAPQMGVLPVAGNVLPPAGDAQQLAPEFLAGQAVQVAPALFPDFKLPQNQYNASISAPGSLKISAGDCKTTLTWTDTSSAETGFAVYRRQIPIQPAAVLVKMLPADTTSYVDQVPTPGKFEYAVEAMGKTEIVPPKPNAPPIVKPDMLNTSRSAPVSVVIKPSAGCITDPEGVKFIYFKPMEVNPTAHNVWKLGLWYSITDGPARRIPASGGSYLLPGKWNSEKEALPLPASLYLNPDQHVIMKIWAVGETRGSFYGDDPRPNLGGVYVSHKLSDLKEKSTYLADGDDFIVRYLLWIDDVKWTGKGTTTAIPAPTNLRLTKTTDVSREIAWDWKGDSQTIDGFILYRSHSCPGRETEILVPKMLPASFRDYELYFANEPAGCAYQYQISAYGRKGESAPSNAINGHTESKYAWVEIFFEDFKNFNLRPDHAPLQTTFYVNHYRFTGTSKVGWGYHKASFAENESLTIGFSVSSFNEDGYLQPGAVCQGSKIVPPISTWKYNKSAGAKVLREEIRSQDKTCELTITIVGYTKEASDEIPGVVSRTPPIVDIAITEFGRIGYQLYARIENHGPEKLSNHPILIETTWRVSQQGLRTEDLGARQFTDVGASVG